jgi:hypothetical protein
MERLPVGTKEYMRVHVEDRSNQVTELPATLTYDVRAPDDTLKYDEEPGNRIGMTAYCLLDTAGWDVGPYRLYVKFPMGAEEPILGPLTFLVDDG